MTRVIRYEPMKYFKGYFMEVTDEESSRGKQRKKHIATLHIIAEDDLTFYDGPTNQFPRLLVRNCTTGAEEHERLGHFPQEQIERALDGMVASFSGYPGSITIHGKRR
ncbi:MAG: hypothetical protein ABIE22_00515 [archaeon]